MAIAGASKDILSQSYAGAKYKCPGVLGEGFTFKQGRYIWMLSKDTITKGMLVAFKAAVDPALCQITRHDHTSTTTSGPSLGIACASSVTGDFTCVHIGGMPDSAAGLNVTLITDGSVAAGLPFVPSTATDGTVVVGTLGSTDGQDIGVAILADSGTDLAPGSYVLKNRFGL